MQGALLECPYDKAHMIEPLRMPYHLMKCRKNHPSMEMAVCPLNANHEVHKAELRYHIQHCPNKALLEKEIMHEALRNASLDTSTPVLKGCTALPKYNYKLDDEICGDEWDRDPCQHRFYMRPLGDNENSRRNYRFENSEPSALRHPTTSSRAAQLSRLGGHRDFDNAADESQKVNDEEAPRAAQTVSTFDKPTLSSTTSSSSSSSSNSSCDPSPPTVPKFNAGVGRGRQAMTMLMGRGRARQAEQSSAPDKPGPPSSSLLASRLQLLRRGVNGSDLNVPAIARGRSMRLTQ